MTAPVTVPAVLSWLSDPLDPGAPPIQCGTRRSSPMQRTSDGELRVFVGDQTQLVAYDSRNLVITITFAALTGDQYQQILNWGAGHLLLLRTVDGRRYYGGWLVSNETINFLAGPLYDFDVTFYVVTYTDEV